MRSAIRAVRERTRPSVGRAATLGLGLLLAFGAAASSEVRVQMTGTQVDLTATAAPLPEVLDRLARLTGMKLVFEGSAPRPLITISVHGRSPTETVLAVMEGLGINFALISDASGTKVQTLLVTGAAAPSPSTAHSPSPAMRANRNMGMAPRMEPPEEDVPLEDLGVPEAALAMPETPPGTTPADPAQVPEPTMTPSPPPSYIPGLGLSSTDSSALGIRPFPAPTPTAPPPGEPQPVSP